MRIFAVGTALCLAACMPTTASDRAGTASVGAEVPHRVLRPGDFQSFVKNWEGDAPLCVRIASGADWDRYFGAAAGNGPPSKPFEPSADLWRTHTGYLLARPANAADDFDSLLKVQSVRRQGSGVQVDTAFNQGSASYQVTTYVLVAIEKPVAGNVTFTDRGQPVCTVRA
jgi:hypothetical protein